MMSEQARAAGYVLESGDGRAIWFLGALLTFKAVGQDTGNQYELVEQWGPQGFGPPLHLHEREAEAFYVLEGEMTFVVGDQTIKASAGAFVGIPPRVKHAFRVESQTAKFLTFITPAGLMDFFAEAGEPAKARSLPPASREPPNVERLERLMEKYGHRPER